MFSNSDSLPLLLFLVFSSKMSPHIHVDTSTLRKCDNATKTGHGQTGLVSGVTLSQIRFDYFYGTCTKYPNCSMYIRIFFGGGGGEGGRGGGGGGMGEQHVLTPA